MHDSILEHSRRQNDTRGETDLVSQPISGHLLALRDTKKCASNRPIARLANSAMNWHKIKILQQGRFVSTQNINFSLHQFSPEATFKIMRNPQHDKTHPFIENSLIEMREINSILRLIILQSLISNGLKSSVLQTYTKLIVQSYGISELKLLLKLQLAGLVKDENFCEKRWDVSYTPGNFNQLIRKYKFALTDLDELRKIEVKIGKPSLLIRIIEEGLQKEWIDFNKTLMETTTENNSNFQQKDEENKQTLIFVIGGITRAEMSILNSLPFKIFCCTTDFMNSNDLINSFRF
uniref:Uncharacterized protein n=1 Tax=Meloidogyne enterolobii TaxID=390850 RepID=A0A6V7WQ98_MELEN|nr:unnamed protein product [Meloidogyne enterolobii]